MAKRKNRKKKKEFVKPTRKRFWIRAGLCMVIVLEIIFIASLKHAQCMNQCVGDFAGPYPEIACKYECPSIWEKITERWKK